MVVLASFGLSCGGDGVTKVLQHTFSMAPAQAGQAPQCMSWSLNNEESLVVNTVDVELSKGWVSANWFYAPKNQDDKQDDGIWKCSERKFSAETALKQGGLLVELTEPAVGLQRFEMPNVVVLPPNTQIVGQARFVPGADTPVKATLGIYRDTVGLNHEGTIWMPKQSSVMARDVDMLFYGILGLCLFFFVAITAAVVILVIKYRDRPGHEPEPSAAHNDILEITWTVIPSIIVVIIFVLGWKGYINLATPPRDALEIKVQGQKWVWSFGHTTEGGDAVQDSVFHVPVNRQVRLIMQSSDVLHSFFVPAFRIKQDVVPGRYTKLWFSATIPGTYRMYCAEYCGRDHSLMKSKVIVHPPGGYERYLAAEAEKQNNLPPAELGAKVYKARCIGCHTTDGTRHTGPTFRGLMGKTEPLEGGRTALVDRNYILKSIVDPRADIVLGYPPSMPTFKGQLSQRQLDGLVEFIKTLK